MLTEWPTKEFKRGESGIFLTPVLTLWGGCHIDRHVCRWVIVPSDLARSLGAIYAHYHYRVIHSAITYMRAWLSSSWKGNSRLKKLLGGLSYEKIWRYNNSPPYVTARWQPQQIPSLNFLVTHSKHYVLNMVCFPLCNKQWYSFNNKSFKKCINLSSKNTSLLTIKRKACFKVTVFQISTFVLLYFGQHL